MSIAGIIAGTALLVLGLIFLGFPATMGIGFGLIGAGVGIIISSGVAWNAWIKDHEIFERDKKKIEDIINMHNGALS